MDVNPYSPFQTFGDTDPLGRQAIEQILQQGRCRSAAYFECTESTNSIALHQPVESSDLPRLIVADRQTAGRGRLGRQWYSDSGTLTFSVRFSLDAIRIPASARSLVALAAGMGVADAAEYYVSPAVPKIKWPNDIYLQDKKIAGLLVEATSEQPAGLVIGVGINVTTDFSNTPIEVRQRATSLRSMAAAELSRYALLPTVLQQIFERLDQLASDCPQLLKQFRKRCYLTGRLIRVRQPRQVVEGTVVGITDRGALQLCTTRGIEEIHAGAIEIVA